VEGYVQPSDGWAENVVPDHEAGPRLQLEVTSRRGRHDPANVALRREEKLDERAGLLSTEPDRLAHEIRERTASQPVEVEISVEEDERRLDHETVIEDLASGKREEPVESVAAPDLETHDPAQRMVEERVHHDSEPHAAAENGATS
jgi:hypothetical protein